MTQNDCFQIPYSFLNYLKNWKACILLVHLIHLYKKAKENDKLVRGLLQCPCHSELGKPFGLSKKAIARQKKKLIDCKLIRHTRIKRKSFITFDFDKINNLEDGE